MEFYQRQYVSILAEDYEKADKILMKHWNSGDIDNIGGTRQKRNNGGDIIAFWIAPYVYEDFETIVNEFKEAGIQIV